MKNLTKHNVATVDELTSHLDKLPTSEEIEELILALDVSTLREMSSAMLIASINYVNGREDKLQYLELLNSWIATAEETIAAGEDVGKILGRRKGKSHRA